MAFQEVGEELIAECHDIQVAVVTEFDLARSVGKGIIETEADFHGGEIETSRIMYTHPHLVRGEGMQEYPAFPDMLLVRNKRRYWPGGVWGDPTKATAEKGKMIEDHVVKRIVDLVKMMAEQTHLNK
jgi:creatinine amidohydrolase